MGKKRRRRNSGSILKAAYKLLPAAALVAPAAGYAMGSATPQQKVGQVIRAYTGYSMPNMGLGTSGFNAGHLAEGWGPFVLTSIMVYGIQKLRGIIRSI
jgi:hypothetical protein